MVPITTVALSTVAAEVGGVALDQIKSALGDLIKEKVIARWSEHRAQKFLNAFVYEAEKERDVKWPSATLSDMLESVGKGDEQTSALFDAYRRVALSASKDLGPMVIGLLTAVIVLAKRDATEDEEQIFAAAELLNDRDFREFVAWMNTVATDESYKQQRQRWRDLNIPAGISVLIRSAVPLSPADSQDMRDASLRGDVPLDLFQDVGAFALKLRNVGVLGESAIPRGTVRNREGTDYYVVIPEACDQLHQLALRAISAMGTR